jgi:hypothetical protein
MGSACSTNGEMRNKYKILIGRRERKSYYLERLLLDGRAGSFKIDIK